MWAFDRMTDDQTPSPRCSGIAVFMSPARRNPKRGRLRVVKPRPASERFRPDDVAQRLEMIVGSHSLEAGAQAVVRMIRWRSDAAARGMGGRTLYILGAERPHFGRYPSRPGRGAAESRLGSVRPGERAPPALANARAAVGLTAGAQCLGSGRGRLDVRHAAGSRRGPVASEC
jgi:hypothetical protein